MQLTAVMFHQAVQSLSRVQLCDPMDGSTPGFPVHHDSHVASVSIQIPTARVLVLQAFWKLACINRAVFYF